MAGFADHLAIFFEDFPSFLDHFERRSSCLPHRVHEAFPIPDGDRRGKCFCILELLLILPVDIGLVHSRGDDTGQSDLDNQLALHVPDEFFQPFQAQVSFPSWFDGCDERPQCENSSVCRTLREQHQTVRCNQPLLGHITAVFRYGLKGEARRFLCNLYPKAHTAVVVWTRSTRVLWSEKQHHSC